MKVTHLCLVVIILLSSTSCWGNQCYVDRIDRTRCLNDTINCEGIGLVPGKAFELKEDIDLGGRVCILPMDVAIKAKGGIFKNGIIVGQDTRVTYNEAVFDNVTIGGSWLIPVIKSSIFKDLSYENSLKDVIALTDPRVHNIIYIDKGIYVVKTEQNEDACITLNSNTELILNGTIQIKPNAFTDYDIIRVEGENITVRGNGVIIGDKFTHLSKEGEWGMGIRVQRSRNIIIKDLTIKDCWGDCIYVGRGSENVRIENSVLDHGRRQGISVTKADRVLIKKCKIFNVGGTPPEYAIDVEPNSGETADNIVIEHVEVSNCKGGFLVYGRAHNAKVGSVTIKRCKATGIKKMPVNILKCENVIVDGCSVTIQSSQQVIKCEDVDNVILQNNIYSFHDNLTSGVKRLVKSLAGKASAEPIVIMRCNRSIVNNNKARN